MSKKRKKRDMKNYLTSKEQKEEENLDTQPLAELPKDILPFLEGVDLPSDVLSKISDKLWQMGYDKPYWTKQMLGKHLGPSLERVCSNIEGADSQKILKAYQDAILPETKTKSEKKKS